jgi:hypothetical protein
MSLDWRKTFLVVRKLRSVLNVEVYMGQDERGNRVTSRIIDWAIVREVRRKKQHSKRSVAEWLVEQVLAIVLEKERNIVDGRALARRDAVRDAFRAAYKEQRTGSVCLNSFALPLSGILPGLRSRCDVIWGATKGGRSPTGVALQMRGEAHAAALCGR